MVIIRGEIMNIQKWNEDFKILKVLLCYTSNINTFFCQWIPTNYSFYKQQI